MPNIVLIGYRGCGKSSTAEELSQKLGCAAIHTDAELERKIGPIVSFVRKNGRAAFRDEGEKLINAIKVVKGKNLVVDCGGGVVEMKGNSAIIKRLGKVV